MAILRYTIISLLILGVFAISNAFGESLSDIWIDGTHRLYEEAQYLLNAVGTNNQVVLAPPLVVGKDPAFAIGDIKKFYAIDMRNNSQYLLDASLYAVSDSAYIFVEKNNPVPADKIKALLNSFDGIYKEVTKNFGEPANTIDNDSRIYILIMDIVDGALPNGVRILGYFNPIDQFRNADISKWTRRRSNEVDMLYIDNISLLSNQVNIESVIAHELIHLIQWGIDPEESTWVNEGIAVYAESFLGYNVNSRISAFERNPNVSLRNWNDKIEDYGAAYLFFAYISEHFGGVKAISDIMANKDNDTSGIEKALAQFGKSVKFDDIFSDWVIANYLDDTEAHDGRYGYSTLDIRLDPSVSKTQYPVSQELGKVLPWSTQYVEFVKNDNEKLNLTIFDQKQNEIKARVIVKTSDGKVDVLPFPSNKDGSQNLEIPAGESNVVMVITSQPDPPDAKRMGSTYNYSAEKEISSISVNPSGNKIITWGSIKKN